MSSTPEIPDSSFRDKVDIDFFGDSVLLTLPRPVLDINTKNFEVFSAPVPVISRDASKILFIEEKVRTYTESSYADTPSDIDLALTLEYFGLDNQPKFKKHIELYEAGMFIPSRLMFVVKDRDYSVHQATLIDYRKLHENADELIESGAIHTNHRDGNETLYLNDYLLDQFDLIIERWSS